MALLPDNVIAKYAELTDYRNRLAHERLNENVNMQAAIECYYFAILIAKRMSYSFGDAPAEPFVHPFRLFGEKSGQDTFLIDHHFG